jgi:long-chain fatty acid transport protein
MGYNFGLSYLLNQTNFLGITYYSHIKQGTEGYSTLGPIVNNDLVFNFTMPATTVLSYTHLFNPTWLVSMQAFHTEWNANQVARFYNTAAQPPLNKDFAFTMQYDAAWAYLAVLRHQYNDKWAFSLAGFLDQGPEVGHLRTINFPSDTQYLGGLMAEYNLNKQTTLQVLYAHVFSKTMIYNQVAPMGQPIPFTTGRVRINAEVLDLRLKIVT